MTGHDKYGGWMHIHPTPGNALGLGNVAWDRILAPMQAPPEAAYIRCGGCGANFGFVPHPGYTRCPYCALDQPVPHELLANRHTILTNSTTPSVSLA